MDAILHTFMALACIAGAFYLGVFLTKRDAFDKIPVIVVEKLIHDGFLCVRRDEDGDERLVSIDTVILDERSRYHDA